MNSFNCLGQYFYETCYFSVTMIHDLRAKAEKKKKKRNAMTTAALSNSNSVEVTCWGICSCSWLSMFCYGFLCWISFYSGGGKIILKGTVCSNCLQIIIIIIFFYCRALETTIWLLLLVR